jgi:hypothetical protein
MTKAKPEKTIDDVPDEVLDEQQARWSGRTSAKYETADDAAGRALSCAAGFELPPGGAATGAGRVAWGQLVYHKRVQGDDLRRGRVIAFRTSDRSGWQPGALVIARIMAGPGDRIAPKDGRYLVNGEPGPPVGDTSRQKPVVLVPPAPASLTVPDDCYFMCQDNPKGSYDSSVLSWAERKNIVSSRVWYLRRDRLLDGVE